MTPAPVTVVRDLRLDLIRGLSLWLIFLDHIPSNIVSWLTIRNYGFSDAAEIFVFVSGYANAYFYGEVVRRGEFFRAVIPIWRRAFQLYAAQILLFVFYVGLVVVIAGGSLAIGTIAERCAGRFRATQLTAYGCGCRSADFVASLAMVTMAAIQFSRGATSVSTAIKVAPPR